MQDMRKSRALVIVGALMSSGVFAGCGGTSGPSDADQIEDAVRAQIEAIKADDCDAFLKVTDISDEGRKRAEQDCDLSMIQLGEYSVGSIAIDGATATVEVTYRRTDPNWGYVNRRETDTWNARRVDGTWKVNHQFPS